MRILIAPDKLKGSLSALDAARAIERGVRAARPDATTDLCPVSDGGEGFVAALTAAMRGKLVRHRVTGPLPEMHVDADLGIADHTAIIEMSSAAGLALLAHEDRNPLNTTTFGVGQLLHFAAASGCTDVLLGIGGSATCDAGVGCLQACGCVVILDDQTHASPSEPLCGRDVGSVVLIKKGRGSIVDSLRIIIACDVTNPLLGPTGTAAVYAPQKGASPDDVRELERMLSQLASRMNWSDHALAPGAGAAGGIGFGLRAMFNASMTSGFDLVSRAVDLRSRVARADLTITAEGQLDSQSLYGKAPAGVARLAKELGKPCVAIAGRVSDRESLASLFDRVESLRDRATDDHDSMTRASTLIEQVAREIAER